MSSLGSFRNAQISGVNLEQLVAAPQHPHVARAQDAEPGLEFRLERISSAVNS